MIAIAVLAKTVKDNYGLIMDENKNPLWQLPPAQRFQTMVYLSVMWTAIFCAAFGLWFWYGQLLAAHVLVILGLVLTSMTFSREQGMSALKVQSKE